MTNEIKDRIQAEALAAVEPLRRAGVGVTMGGGKTTIGLKHMAKRLRPGSKFLVAAPKVSIFDSWINDAKKMDMEYLLAYIRFTTYRSLAKQELDFDCIYLDECHSLLPSHDFWLSNYGGPILGLTGSPPRYASSAKGRIVNKFCPIVYTYITDNAVDDGMLNDYRIILHHLKLGKRKEVAMKNKTTGATWYQSEENAYKYWNDKITVIEETVADLSKQMDAFTGRVLTFEEKKEKMIVENRIAMAKLPLSHLRIMRMKALMNTPTKVKYAGWLLDESKFKVLVFANTQEQADSLCPNSYHAKNPDSKANLEMFNQGVIDKMSCVQQLSEGINIKDLREAIILHAYSNERKSAQRLGRLLRLNPDEIAMTHVLVFDDTMDEVWAKEAFRDFDQEKIYHYYPATDMFVNIYGEDVEGVEMPWGFYHPPRMGQLIQSLTA
jgi:superfamily II DNA or RNA helicase